MQLLKQKLVSFLSASKWFICCFLLSIPASAIEIYGHRGAAGLAPENTIEAMRIALDIGVHVLDMDVMLTKDNVVVLSHDYKLNPNITKNSSGNWLKNDNLTIKDVPYSQLAKYDVGTINPNSPYKKNFPLQRSKTGEKIPTLQEVIKYAKTKTQNKIKYQIEIKTNPLDKVNSTSPEKIVPAIIKILQAEGITHLTEVHSFDWRNLFLLQKLAPKITTSYLTNKFYFLNAKGGPQEMIWTTGFDKSNFDNSYPKMIKHLGGKVWCPYFKNLTEEQLKIANNLGIKVVVWTVDTPADMLKMIDMGVDGIVSNRPDILKEIIAAKH